MYKISPPFFAGFLVVSEFVFGLDWKKDKKWIFHFLVIILEYECTGDYRHGTKSPKFDHGQQAKEVGYLCVERLGVKDILNGIDKDI